MHVPRLVAVLVVVRGDELVPAREAIHDEVVSRRVEATVHDRRDDEKESKNEGRARAHDGES